MKRVIPFLLAMALTAPAAAQCGFATTDDVLRAVDYVVRARACLVTPPDGAAFDTELEQAFFQAVNRERVLQGLPPLVLRIDLRDPARFHALDMAVHGYFAHVGPDGRSVAQRIALLDRSLLTSRSGENLAMFIGDESAEAILARLHLGLMASPGHRDNILSENWTHLAIGVARSGDRVLVTQLFTRVDGEITPELPARVTPGERVNFSIELGDWTPREAIWQADAPTGRVSTPLGPNGTFAPVDDIEAMVFVAGVQAGTSERTYRVLEFFGPAVTVAEEPSEK